jgi:hypothetical protein
MNETVKAESLVAYLENELNTRTMGEFMQMIRKDDLVRVLELAMPYFAKGNQLALLDVLGNKAIPVREELERQEMVDLDIIQEMQGE